MLEEIGFYIFAAAVIFFFINAVVSTNILYAISSLAAGMVLLSAHYFLLNAEFIGVAQIAVYSGAILGLFAFAMMFFDLSKPLKEKNCIYKLIAIGALSAVGLLVALFNLRPAKSGLDIAIAKGLDNTQQLGVVLFSKYLLAFELVALVLLIALVAALMLIAKKENK